MLELYWACLIGGALFALVAIVFGDVLDAAFDGLLDFLSADGADFLNPLTLVGGIAMLGGTGVLLTKYTSWGPFSVALLALLAAVFLGVCLHFFYVKSMRKAENSNAYSIRDFIGLIGEVTTPIPPGGYGEVMLKVGAGRSNEIAASWESGAELPAGSRIVVIDAKEGVLYVSPFDK